MVQINRYSGKNSIANFSDGQFVCPGTQLLTTCALLKTYFCSPMAISFHTDQTLYVLQKKRLIKSCIHASVHAEGYECGDISIVLCSDERLLEMNNQFLQHDYYTDIITFDYSVGKKLNGDLFISIDRVKDNALKNQVSTKNELYRVIIHGIMHLAGYKDKKKNEVLEMRKAEDRHLNKWQKSIDHGVSRETKNLSKK